MSSKEQSNKSVRFAADIESSSSSRPRDDNDTTDKHHERRKKRPRLERPNEDEVDDVDDWQDDDEEGDEAVPKPHELLHAKRKRRERQHGEDIDDSNDDEEKEETYVDERTSLFAEKDTQNDEVAVEPFNMDAEQNDGSGYFDGDTYVFRKREAQEEPDAWLESLSESKQQLVASLPEKMEEDEDEGGTGMDSLSKEELYTKIVPLVGENESVLQAVARYGNLLKRRQGKSKGSSIDENDSSTQAAQKALNDLTEAANALMLKGHVDIYQQTKSDLVQLIPDTKPPATKQQQETGKQVVSWEYRGNQDGQIHGPYTTAQMLSWTQAGYFVGAQAVQIRTIRNETVAKDKSIGEDLMSDLMDDDEDDEANEAESTQVVKGEWQSSNNVDFTSYG